MNLIWMETDMNRPSFRSVAATLLSKLRFPRLGVGVAIFGAPVLVAIALSPVVLAHEVHHAEAPATQSADEAAFLKENEAVMTKMMNNMAARPTGDVDRDFVAMMSPHHQGPIDMAVIELRYGKNEQLRRIAQEIIIDQMQEIAAMKLAIGEKVDTPTPAPTEPQSTPATTQFVPATSEHHHHLDGCPPE
jgi:electron transfer flavoprotein alpha subunit